MFTGAKWTIKNKYRLTDCVNRLKMEEKVDVFLDLLLRRGD